MGQLRADAGHVTSPRSDPGIERGDHPERNTPQYDYPQYGDAGARRWAFIGCWVVALVVQMLPGDGKLAFGKRLSFPTRAPAHA